MLGDVTHTHSENVWRFTLEEMREYDHLGLLEVRANLVHLPL